MPKIYIVGACGCGKSTVARRLSQKLKIPHLDLDDVAWAKSDKKNFMVKRSDAEKQAFICAFLSENPSWIVEGAQNKDWVLPFVQACTAALVIEVNPFVRDFRILRRSLRRKLGTEKSNHKENFLGVCRLLRYNHRYDKEITPKILARFREAKKQIHKVK